MARATHLTISTADRIRLDGCFGEENEDGREDGENEVRQEVQVSVTYALDDGDTNLVRLAEAKALEVKLAHEAVWNRIGAFSSTAFSGGNSSSTALSGGNSSSTALSAASSNGSGRSHGSSPNRCSGRQAPDEEEDEDRNGEYRKDGDDDPDNDSHGAGLPPAPPPVDPPLGGPARGAWYMPGGSRSGNGSAGPELSPDADADPVTGPQKILIRSRAKKLGLTSYALDALVFQQFKVWKVERLSKDQATLLLAALERDLKEKGGKQEKDGKEGVSHADRNGRAATA